MVTGIQTEQCAETTTRVAADLGYDADFVTEATLTFPMRDRFARIATVQELLEEVGALATSS